ncbi:MAG: aldo/keto reductase [Verrucomicrobia bacterium]|nr:aldo/keto reductase [Verrucomicrobiota bacterium]MCH8514158.1 aldo/keto reductase [Kiritimatiellia bacterium]
MKKIVIPHTGLEVSELIYGCMRIRGRWSDDPLTEEEITNGLISVRAALDCGINFFDHADIYGRGRCEELFGHLWKRENVKRDALILQSKCGIRPGVGYDFRPDYIQKSVEGSLKRLQTDYLDILLLHRPDILMEPDAIAETFETLYAQGKVRYFGVSNFTPALQRMLQSRVSMPLITNQIRFGLGFTHPVESWLVAGGGQEGIRTRGEGILEHCMEVGVSVQAYSPVVGGGIMEPIQETDSERLRNLKEVLQTMAKEKGVGTDVLALAWVARHPAGIQPIIGTTRPERIQSAAAFGNVKLTHEEWYKLFIAARGQNLP